MSWMQYHYSSMQDRRSTIKHIFATQQHKMGVQVASANVQNAK